MELLIGCQHLTLNRIEEKLKIQFGSKLISKKFSRGSYRQHRVKSEQLQCWRTVLISACCNKQWKTVPSSSPNSTINFTWQHIKKQANKPTNSTLPPKKIQPTNKTKQANKKPRRKQDFAVETTIWSDNQSLPGKYTVICINLTCWKAECQNHVELQIFE